MNKFREIIAIIVLLMLWSAAAKVDNESRQNVILHETVRTLLGFRESPSRESKSMPHPPNPGEDAPKYMMDLYERFKSGPISKGKLSGNTVRSIQAETAEVNGEAMFVFNLTSIVTSEEMISAEIHLYKRKQKPRRKNLDIELLIYEIAPHYISQTSKITMRAESFGWQWFDVTEGVKSCLAARRDHPYMFALKFRAEKLNGKQTILALKKFMHHHSVPYLIVYSNDTENVSLEKLDKFTESFKAIKNTDKDENALGSNSQRSKRDLSGMSTDGTFRQSRSLFTNEIPEDPNDYRKYAFGFNMPQTHPGMLQARKEQKHRQSDSSLIPYPDSSTDIKNKRKWRRKHKNTKNRKNRNKKNKQELPFRWDDYHDNMATEENSGKLCSKKKLIVDFHDIGWGEWIISPKSFEAHYCSGSCPFPLTKKLRPSNHATIQSIVNAIGIYADVPAPCCVPESLSSMMLLYFDENGNVVLKNYPGMTVQTCACR